MHLSHDTRASNKHIRAIYMKKNTNLLSHFSGERRVTNSNVHHIYI